MNAAFFDAVRISVFGGALKQDHVDGINQIAAAWEKYGDGDKRKLAYILATAYHETAHTMQPVREAYWLSDSWRKKNLRYYPYYGRGYVQLTWAANYQDWADRTGLDLLTHPDKVMEPKLAARILVEGSMLGTFTGKKLGDYIGTDFVNARRVINGKDKAKLIAGLADDFLDALEAVKPEPVEPPTPSDTFRDDPETGIDETKPPAKEHWLIALLRAIFTRSAK